MALRRLLTLTILLAVTSCGGGEPTTDSGSARLDGPTRLLADELDGADPTFIAAVDAFDRDRYEPRLIEMSGLALDDLGLGYFGQRLYVSLWRPVDDDAAMSVCHELVTLANDIDFPATSIEVTKKTYADLEKSEILTFVDASGACVMA